MQTQHLMTGLATALVLAVLALSFGPAVPAHAESVTITVDTTSDINDATHRVCTTVANDCSLRGAITRANTFPDTAYTIIVPAGTYLLTAAGAWEDNNASGDLDIKANLTLVGEGPALTRIDGFRSDRALQIHPGYAVSITGLSITNGWAPAGAPGTTGVAGDPGASGGGIWNGGVLTLTNSIVNTNKAGDGGGNGFPGGVGGAGGGIYNKGTLTLISATLGYNSSGAGGSGGTGANASGGIAPGTGGNGGPGGAGAAIYNSGALTLNQVTIANNMAGKGGGGGTGGMGKRGFGSLVPGAHGGMGGTGGQGGTGGDGGLASLYSNGPLTITNSTISLNTGGDGGQGGTGGEGGTGGSADLEGGTGGTGGDGGWSGYGMGGAIFNLSTLTMTASTLNGNQGGRGGRGGAGGQGGSGGDGVCDPSPTCTGGTGGNGGHGYPGRHGGYGGAIFNSSAMTLTNTTVISNTAGSGGTGGAGGLPGPGGGGFTVGNPTTAPDGSYGWSGSGGDGGNGGGIYNQGSPSLNNVTVSSNAAGSFGAGGPGLYPGFSGGPGLGGGIAMIVAVSMRNSIVAGNTASGGAPDCYGALTSQGYNLIRNTSSCTVLGDTAGNITGQDPKLGALGNHGGSVQTLVLAYDSPAIDAGNPASPGSGGNACATEDARGEARSDLRCDMGAFEVKAADATTIRKCNLAADTYTFGPTSVQVQVTTLGTLSCLDVQRTETNHPQAGTQYQTGRYWTMTPTGSGYTVNLSLFDTLSDPTIGLDGHYTGTGTNWDGKRTSSTATLITRSGVTNLLGDWAVGLPLQVYQPLHVYLPLVVR